MEESRPPRPAPTSGPHLRDREWKSRYSHEDGDLVRIFYEPVLSRAKVYRRVTGYFSGDVLALAARGLEPLIQRGGHMELVVGCTLGPEEVKAIERGYDLRGLMEKGLTERLPLSVESERAREQVGWLAWMIAEGLLDIKVAIPKDEAGRFRAGLGLYHAKVGIAEDAAGEALVFEGSINETQAGWLINVESFSVSGSWYGDRDRSRVESAQVEFGRLWRNEARSAEVLEFPEACKLELLRYLPTDDAFVRPPRVETTPEREPPEELGEPPVETLPDEERCRRVWSFIRNAPRRPDGALVAVRTSAIDPWPHQLRAYRRMLDSWPCRLLIADEVGLGKTIEAGLLIRHAWISELARRILILVPKAVLLQWQAELYEKFNLLVPIYTGAKLVWPEHHSRRMDLEREVGRSEWTEAPFVLTSSHLVRREDRQGELLDGKDWDLVILDEAHHARRKGAGSAREQGPNRLLELMRRLQDKTRALLLLTATPMQVDPVEVLDLIALLGIPPEWNASAFRGYFEALPKNPNHEKLHELAQLFQAVERHFGSLPDEEASRIAERCKASNFQVRSALNALREPQSTIPLKRLGIVERRAAIACLRAGTPLFHRMSRHTRHLLREYHARGLLETPLAEREVRDLPIQMSAAEQRVYAAVEDYISDTYEAAPSDQKTAVGFVMTVYRRRMASSFYALRCTLTSRLERLRSTDRDRPLTALDEDASQDEQRDEVMSPEEAAELSARALRSEQADGVRALLREVATLATDTKARRLVEELQANLTSDFDRAIVFTQYTDTLEYLRELLANDLALPIGCFSGEGGRRRDLAGSWQPVAKEEIKRLLREGGIRILVCTDAAGEGLNLQSCGLLVNYDLPWNPMKVEQRIGRIDRIGQQRATVRIINLAYANTVEADVYFTLSERIGLFQGVVGKLQPILSRVARQFETIALLGSGHRDRARQDAVRTVTGMVDQAQMAAFDIDEVSEADLDPPVFPRSPLEPEDLERVLGDPGLLPRGTECRPLDHGTYALRMPGWPDAARVTTRPPIFEEHFESHQLLFADGPIYRSLIDSIDFESSAPTDAPSGTLQDLLTLIGRAANPHRLR